MRLDPVLDSVYTLGSLWGALTGPAVCPASPRALRSVVPEVAEAPGAPAAVTAFVQVNVIPMDTERVLANHTVLVAGGKITALGPSDKVKVPAGAVQVDGRGQYLLPGLADMHTHFSGGYNDYHNYPLLFSYIASGITAVRYTNSISGSAHNFRRPNTAAEHPSPYLYLAGNLQEFARPGLSPDSVAAAYQAAGYDFIAGDAPDSLLAAARRLGLPLGIHIPHWSSFGQMLAYGRGTAVEHLHRFRDTLKATGLEAGTAAWEAELRALAAATRRAGIWVTPTLHCHTNGSEFSSSPPPPVKLVWRIAKALQDAGVGLLLSGDDEGDVHDELAVLVRAGLTPYQALRTGTYNPAEYLGQLNERGTVAVGKRADLVLLYGNPLQNIRHTQEPAGVMLNGRWLDRAALDRGLLADPKAWIRLVVNPGMYIGRSGFLRSGAPPEQIRTLLAHLKRFEALADSLPAATPTSLEAERVRRGLAAELGAMRAVLPPELQALFDPRVRVWLREQARQGYPVAIPGVAPAP